MPQGRFGTFAGMFFLHQLECLGRKLLVHLQHRADQQGGGTTHFFIGALPGSRYVQAIGHGKHGLGHALVAIQNMKGQPLGEEGK